MQCLCIFVTLFIHFFTILEYEYEDVNEEDEVDEENEEDEEVEIG